MQLEIVRAGEDPRGQEEVQGVHDKDESQHEEVQGHAPKVPQDGLGGKGQADDEEQGDRDRVGDARPGVQGASPGDEEGGADHREDADGEPVPPEKGPCHARGMSMRETCPATPRTPVRNL